MKAGRNDTCPCGSGKKYKKCCLAKDNKRSLEQTAASSPPPSSVGVLRPASAIATERPSLLVEPRRPRRQTAGAPLAARSDRRARQARWREFESQSGEARIAVFLETLEDVELMDDDFAFEMLSVLHPEAGQNGSRTRFAECVDALRERLAGGIRP